ncbi:MAG: hypothetical protein HY360_25390 [Verrucomicrobia bacterium]|nr:hypothetical protein [Verrucomicrobiota bacterium]
MKSETKAFFVAAAVATVCFLLPGFLLLAGLDLERGNPEDAPNWARALVGLPFLIFGIMMIVAAICGLTGRSWRSIALNSLMTVFPAVALLLAWPASQITLSIPGIARLVPGGAPIVFRIIFGAASVVFAYASFILWWLVLSRRVGPEDIRGIGES